MRVDLVLANWPLFAQGVWITLQLTFLALAIGFCIGLPAGIARARRIRYLSPAINAYVYVFRGTPLLVQTFLIYYGLSQFEWVRDSWAWVFLRDAWWCALIAFSLNSAAYCAEIVRAAIQSINKGQSEAAKALGMTYGQTMSTIIIPQSIRRMIPPLCNEFVMMIKDVSLVFAISLMDITTISKSIMTSEGNYLVFFPALVIFLRGGKAARRKTIPLGPFLALGAVVALFAGDAIIDWYVELGSQ
jgi:arginine/ornithine transport system permease protein